MKNEVRLTGKLPPGIPPEFPIAILRKAVDQMMKGGSGIYDPDYQAIRTIRLLFKNAPNGRVYVNDNRDQ